MKGNTLDQKTASFSVLMSIYQKTNPNFLDQSIDSIWTQQSLKPSEIVIVCDGPILVCVEKILTKWSCILKDRFIVVRLSVNSGLSVALNKGLEKCSFDLVARMDDDISLPSRFLCQYTFMQLHKDIAVLGTQVEERSEDLKHVISSKTLPLSSEKLLVFSKWRCPLNHPSVIFRKSLVQLEGGYPNIYPEDYPLWGKMIAKGYKLQNLPEKLVIMRQEQATINRRGLKFFRGEVRVLNFLYGIGHITLAQYFTGVLIRLMFRLSPKVIKKLLYYVFK